VTVLIAETSLIGPCTLEEECFVEMDFGTVYTLAALYTDTLWLSNNYANINNNIQMHVLDY